MLAWPAAEKTGRMGSWEPDAAAAGEEGPPLKVMRTKSPVHMNGDTIHAVKREDKVQDIRTNICPNDVCPTLNGQPRALPGEEVVEMINESSDYTVVDLRYRCAFCRRKWENPEDIKLHIKQVHLDEWTEAELCKAILKPFTAEQVVQMKIMKYKCRLCKKAVAMKESQGSTSRPKANRMQNLNWDDGPPVAEPLYPLKDPEMLKVDFDTVDETREHLMTCHGISDEVLLAENIMEVRPPPPKEDHLEIPDPELLPKFEPSSDILPEIEIPNTNWENDEVQTFRPNKEEFEDLRTFVANLEKTGAAKTGICRVVVPHDWIPRKQGYNPADLKMRKTTDDEGIEVDAGNKEPSDVKEEELVEMTIHGPVQQNIITAEVAGAFKTIADRSLPSMSIAKYTRLATSEKYMTPPHNSYDELEELYWKQNRDDKLLAPIYGADVTESITDPDVKGWNIKRLDSLLTEVMKEQIPGVNLPYLYFGMWKATFSWHIEDMDLYACNYLHFGAPKTWYCVPPEEGYKLEQLARKLFPDFAKNCYNLLRHKAIMIGPKLLQANGIKVNKVVQEERNLIIVFPHAYHAGFNHGFNMAESTNFALERWLEYGKRFRDCVCRGEGDEVRFDLNPFIEKIQPEKLEAWMNKEDWSLHPEDPWFIKRCLLDAVIRLERNEITELEFNKLKKHLRRKIEIPAWFKERFSVDYRDDLENFHENMQSIVNVDKAENIDDEEGDFPKDEIRSMQITLADTKEKLLRRLEEHKGKWKVKIEKEKKIRPGTFGIYHAEMKEYQDYMSELDEEEKERKMALLNNKGADGLGDGAARGVGFKGANMDDLLEKKSKVVCRAKKRHRFKACTKCTGCRSGNCGECEYCLDMPRFGGPGLIKQKCETRVCVNPMMTTCDQCEWIM